MIAESDTARSTPRTFNKMLSKPVGNTRPAVSTPESCQFYPADTELTMAPNRAAGRNTHLVIAPADLM